MKRSLGPPGLGPKVYPGRRKWPIAPHVGSTFPRGREKLFQGQQAGLLLLTCLLLLETEAGLGGGAAEGLVLFVYAASHTARPQSHPHLVCGPEKRSATTAWGYGIPLRPTPGYTGRRRPPRHMYTRYAARTNRPLGRVGLPLSVEAWLLLAAVCRNARRGPDPLECDPDNLCHLPQADLMQ